MNEYIFYTPEGYTIPPIEGKEAENCQVLGQANGRTQKEAKEFLIKDNPWIKECGFDIHKMICKQIVSDKQMKQINKEIEFLINLLDKRQLEEYIQWLDTMKPQIFCKDKLKDNGTIWISGTYHNIFSIENCLRELGYKILNIITWVKTNPPPNISCRYFTYSTEFIIWARKSEKKPHYFNYDLMKQINNNKQMTDVWHIPAIAPWEKSCGKHPTQKPINLLARIIMASTQPNEWILDPFCGSATTGIAANLLGRRFLGIEQEEEFVKISKNRREEIEKFDTFQYYYHKIKDLKSINQDSLLLNEEANNTYGDLPF